MKRVVFALAAAVIVCRVSWGQEEVVTSHFEHLKCYQQLIGQWQYEGPILEDIKGVVEKGGEVSARVSYRWIVEKNAIESNFNFEVKDGMKGTAKNLILWDPSEKRILEGGVNSLGGHVMSSVTYDAANKSWTMESKGVDGKGEPTSATVVITMQDENTYIYQAFNRQGGLAEGDSPKYTYKRVESAKGAKRRKQ